MIRLEITSVEYAVKRFSKRENYSNTLESQPSNNASSQIPNFTKLISLPRLLRTCIMYASDINSYRGMFIVSRQQKRCSYSGVKSKNYFPNGYDFCQMCEQSDIIRHYMALSRHIWHCLTLSAIA